MSLDQPALGPAFQPAFVMETTLGFLDEGLTRGAYYHIRDSFVDEQQFAQFMSPKGAAFVARWWNDTPQYDGLYDNQGHVRPAYYAFKLLSLIKGQQLAISGAGSDVKGFAVKSGAQINVVVWNFPSSGPEVSQEVTFRFPANKTGQFRVTRLAPASPFNQLELERQGNIAELQDRPIRFTLRPYEIRWAAVNE
jgi:hypothetical protein